MSALPQPHFTPDEYLALDRSSTHRNEYLDGVIYAMSGGSYAHAVIIANLTRIFGNLLLETDCRATAGDTRIRAASVDGPYFYPDVVVVCGPAQFADDLSDTVLNPVLLAEVLSPFTESYDRLLKFDQYRRIPSLQEYLLVSQSEPRVHGYRRREGSDWLFAESAGVEGVYRSECLGISVPLSDIYRKVTIRANPA